MNIKARIDAQVARSVMNGAGYQPPLSVSSEKFDITKNNIKLEELLAMKDTDPERYNRISRNLRQFWLSFDQPDVKLDNNLLLTLRYQMETPLNLPVFAGQQSANSDLVKNQISSYRAVNSFARTYEMRNLAGNDPGTQNASEAEVTVFVNAPAGRGYIGDYVWLDANNDGIQNEVTYEIPDYDGKNLLNRPLPKRKRVMDPEGNISYEPDWGTDADGNLLPDPGINGVKVELMSPNGKYYMNQDGQAVNPVPRSDGTYTVLAPNTGEPAVEGSTGYAVAPSQYGPVSCVTRSDYYGNQGYYILPDLQPGEYTLRFTMPEEYNHYGLTTQELGVQKVPMATYTPENSGGSFSSLTFQTKTTVKVEAVETEGEAWVRYDQDSTSYDVGIGLPVRYGGYAWVDSLDAPDEDPTLYADTNYDGIYQTVLNPEYEGDVEEKPLAGVTINVYEADKDGSMILKNGLPVLATDMHGEPMTTVTDADGKFLSI